MACFHPLQAWQRSDGQVVFSERGDIVRSLSLPCGRCVGCRLDRSRQWAVRIMHELSLHRDGCFLTLTYDDDHLPPRGSLRYRDFQLFFKRLRKRVARPLRFFVCGEYGENLLRPHFHCIVFGFQFADLVPWKRGGSGSVVYRSPLLEELWPFGFSSVGDVTFESAAYVSRYVVKKVTGQASEAHYSRVCVETGEVYQLEPEFCRMSLKPGIGFKWFEKFYADVFPGDFVLSRGRESKPPRYYDKLYERFDPDAHEAVVMGRELAALEVDPNERSFERLAVREQVVVARLSNFKREGV